MPKTKLRGHGNIAQCQRPSIRAFLTGFSPAADGNAGSFTQRLCPPPRSAGAAAPLCTHVHAPKSTRSWFCTDTATLAAIRSPRTYSYLLMEWMHRAETARSPRTATRNRSLAALSCNPTFPSVFLGSSSPTSRRPHVAMMSGHVSVGTRTRCSADY